MKITIKVLQGQECTLEVTEDTNVIELKRMIERQLQFPLCNQKLIFMGKPLSDLKTLKEYSIKDGAKMILVIKKSDDANPGPREVTSLQDAVTKFLRKYYNESDSKKVLSEFMKEFDRSMADLSLDDIERMAAACALDEKHSV